jgi:predicted PurR-regulated permease PerM
MSNARLVATLIIVFLAGWLIYLLAPVLTPFLTAALLAYIGNPLVSRLERSRVPRVWGVVLVFIIFTGAFAGLVFYLVPVLRDSIVSFSARLPAYYDLALAQLPRLERWLGVDLKLDPTSLRDTLTTHWRGVGDWATTALDIARRSGLTVVGWIANLVLIPVVTFYLLLDWNLIARHLDGLVPPKYRMRTRSLLKETDAVLANFFRGQLSVMLALAAIYSLGLWLIGLDLAFPIGIVAGLVSFVPYLGFITGLIAANVAAYLQFHEVLPLLWVSSVFITGQVLEGVFLTPRLVGDRIGLHPVAVIFAVMAGGQLFGFVGVLLALPAAAAIKIWLRHAHELWTVAPARAQRR